MSEETEDSRIRTVSTEEFELGCLEMIDLVEEKGITFIVTKGGKPLAMLKPVRAPKAFSSKSGDRPNSSR